MKSKNLLYLSFITFLLWNCSSKEIVKEEVEKILPKTELIKDVNLNVEKTISWVNLMPGSKPKFHISGKFNLLKSDDYNIENMKLKYVKVYQSDKEVYFVKPKVRVEDKGDIKQIMFSTLRGLSINKKLNTKQNVMFEFIFNDTSNDFIYQIKDVELQEVY